MKKNIFTWSAIGICLLSILMMGCKGCTKAEEEAWAKFVNQAKECSAQYDAFIANCNSQEAAALAELQTCQSNCQPNLGGCGVDINCIVRDLNACHNRCMDTYRQKLNAIEDCKKNWNVEFWNCMNAKQK